MYFWCLLALKYGVRRSSVTYVIALPCVDITAPAWRNALSTASTRAGVSSTSTLTSASTAAPAQLVCPVEAIYYEDDLPEMWVVHTEGNARFFSEILPGVDTALGSPGGAAKLGPIAAAAPAGGGDPTAAVEEASPASTSGPVVSVNRREGPLGADTPTTRRPLR
jgi:hypothetical protein